MISGMQGMHLIKLSTGRYNVNIADSFEEAMNAVPLPIPDLSGLQNGLLKSFPIDLWL